MYKSDKSTSEWIFKYIFELGMLTLERITKHFKIPHLKYLEMRKELIEDNGKPSSLMTNNAYTALAKLQCGEGANGVLEMVQMAINPRDYEKGTLAELLRVIRANRVFDTTQSNTYVAVSAPLNPKPNPNQSPRFFNQQAAAATSSEESEPITFSWFDSE